MSFQMICMRPSLNFILVKFLSGGVYLVYYLMVHIFPIMLQERPAREADIQPVPRKVNFTIKDGLRTN